MGFNEPFRIIESQMKPLGFITNCGNGSSGLSAFRFQLFAIFEGVGNDNY